MDHQALGPTALRYTAYSAVLLGSLLLLPTVARVGGTEAFYEGAFVEWLQFAIVSLAAVLLLIGAWRLERWRQLLGVLAVMATVAAVREKDDLLDHFVPWLWGWKGPALAVGALGFVIALRDLPKFGSQVEPFARTTAFAVLWAGTFIVVGAAQLIGHGDLLRIVMADAYDADIKRVVEESFELFGYLMVLAGAIETLIRLPYYHPSPVWRGKGPDDAE